jgi:hypothetical protein
MWVQCKLFSVFEVFEARQVFICVYILVYIVRVTGSKAGVRFRQGEAIFLYSVQFGSEAHPAYVICTGGYFQGGVGVKQPKRGADLSHVVSRSRMAKLYVHICFHNCPSFY